MKIKLGIVIILFALVLSACGGGNVAPAENQAAVEEQTAEEPAEEATVEEPAEPVHLSVAVLPILDALPMHVALEQGYFADQNLDVELVPVTSAPERDQLMQAGQIDAMINEIVSTMFYNQQEVKVVIVRFARAASADSPVFSIVASAESGITTPEELAGVEIGISEGTVIEYVTDRVLENAGLSPDEIAKIAIPRIPDRLNLLQSGELAAGVLPDPTTTLAVLNGATVVIDDSSLPEVGTSVISFSVDTLTEKPDAVRGFLAALEMAVADLNDHPGDYIQLISDLGMVPVPLLETYQLPPYVTASVPTEAQWADALAWTQGKGLIEGDLLYTDSVDASYLP